MNKWGIPPIVMLLFVGIFISTAVLIFVEYAFKDDGQVFQVIGALVVGFSSSFFTKLKSGETTPPPPGSTTSTTVDQVVVTPPTGEKNV